MRKKWLTVGATFGIGAAMLAVGGISAMANTSGYDAYKEALKMTKSASSMTADVQLTVTDNGAKVLAGTASLKQNQASNAGSVSAEIGGGTETHSVKVFRQDGKVIVKSSDSEVYKVMDLNGSQWRHDGSQNPPKAAEQIFNALLGNIRELATVESESDGGKHAALHLSGSQVPAVVNALGTLAVTKAADAHPIASLPKLTDHIQVDRIDLDAQIGPDNMLKEQTAVIGITGKDGSGSEHEVMIQLRVDFSGLNQTVPERVDLSGKQTEQIQHDGAKRGWNH